MRVEWLSAVDADEDPWDESRPSRPNLPMLRWFSFTKWHAIQLGVFTGLLTFWLVQLEFYWTAAACVLYIAQHVVEHRRVTDECSTCEHGIGIHDAVRKPWYFGTALLATTMTLSVLLSGSIIPA